MSHVCPQVNQDVMARTVWCETEQERCTVRPVTINGEIIDQECGGLICASHGCNRADKWHPVKE